MTATEEKGFDRDGERVWWLRGGGTSKKGERGQSGYLFERERGREGGGTNVGEKSRSAIIGGLISPLLMGVALILEGQGCLLAAVRWGEGFGASSAHRLCILWRRACNHRCGLYSLLRPTTDPRYFSQLIDPFFNTVQS